MEILLKGYVFDDINKLPEEIVVSRATHTASYMFDVDRSSLSLSNVCAEIFHKILTKLLFVCKRA